MDSAKTPNSILASPIHKGICVIGGFSKRQVVLTSEGLFERGWWRPCREPTTPAIPMYEIQSVSVDLLSFSIHLLSREGMRSTKSYSPHWMAGWVDAFVTAEILCENASIFDPKELGGWIRRYWQFLAFLPLACTLLGLEVVGVVSLFVPRIGSIETGLPMFFLIFSILWLLMSLPAG